VAADITCSAGDQNGTRTHLRRPPLGTFLDTIISRFRLSDDLSGGFAEEPQDANTPPSSPHASPTPIVSTKINVMPTPTTMVLMRAPLSVAGV